MDRRLLESRDGDLEIVETDEVGEFREFEDEDYAGDSEARSEPDKSRRSEK